MFLGLGENVSDGPGFAYGVSIDQSPENGVVWITMVDTGNIDVWGVTGPDGTKSTRGDFGAGTTITLRSNERVISYLNDPESNITLLTTSGTKTVENVSELPTEYQKAPDGLINADTSGYDNASVATVACLFDDHRGIKMGGRQIPANVSIPCNTPVLAQNDSVAVGTSVKPTSGPNAGKTLTSPITLKSGGEYNAIGAIDDEEVSITFTVQELRERDESNGDNYRTASDGHVAGRLEVAGAANLVSAGGEPAQEPRGGYVRNGKGYRKGAI